MGGIKTFRDLQVWQKAHQLVLMSYSITRNFPLLLSKDLCYVDEVAYQSFVGLSDEVGKLLTRWIQSQKQYSIGIA